MAKPTKYRLDELLVHKGLCDSRSRAKALILAGKVWLGTERLDKPGKPLPEDTPIELEQPPRFVSRGGEKLLGFLKHFELSPEGKTVLDVGASTGGFTDCCLQHGALSATCIDVGRAQLHQRILDDPRVQNFEKLNARHLQPGELPLSAYDWVVMDLSFISLTLVLGPVWQFLAPGGILVALVKPQFEAQREEVNAGKGIIRDPEIRQRILNSITKFALDELPGVELLGSIESPISGTDGNQEYLLGLRRQA